MRIFAAVFWLAVAITGPSSASASPATLASAGQEHVVAWLRANDIWRLSTYLMDSQHQFEIGTLTETALRNVYRPLYELDPVAATNLRAWAEGAPNSYVAHLAFGIYLKRLGRAARGDKYLSETPISKQSDANRYFKYATDELHKSTQLTAKPCLSFFHLIDIDTHTGDQRESAELIEKANKICPANALIRDNYVVSLLPRWGGSYSAVEAFIEASKKQGSNTLIIAQLEAIKHDDLGHALEEGGSHEAARAQFQKALALGMEAGGTFNVDWLYISRYYICTVGNVYPYCH